MLVKDTTFLVGNTPLVELTHFEDKYNLKAKIFAKVELFNPAGSVKDRIALAMILDAESKGLLKKGSTIIEPTSGNTGIGIASISAMKGYRCILVMPETMSIERRKILLGYGAELVLSDGSKGMKGAIEKANELLKEVKDSIILSQFENPANPMAHYKTTGPEIYKDLNGKVDVLVAGVGTGGTISGVAKYLKERIDVNVVAVEPATSAVISGELPGKHAIQGIGAGFIPKTFDRSLIDEVSKISDEEAISTAKEIAKLEGLSVGISSGAALAAALKEAKKDKYKNKNIVVIFPDSGDRYLSTKLYE